MRGDPHHHTCDTTSDSAGHRVAARLGLRRLSWVRVVVDEGSPVRCEVAGVGNRLPVVVPVPLATATALASMGVPTVFRRSVSQKAPDGRLPLPSSH